MLIPHGITKRNINTQAMAELIAEVLSDTIAV